MPNPDDILSKLRTKLFMKQMKTSVGEDDNAFVDVPNVDDDEYKTFVRIPPVQQEQDKEEPPEGEDPTKEPPMQEEPPEGEEQNKDIPPEEEPPPEEDMPPEGDIPPEDPGMEGEGQLTATEIGRVYELKKIFSRLTSIESYLSDSSDLTLLKLRNYVSQAIEMFEILISNIDSFKDNIDEIILIYYKFIEKVYGLIDKHYKNQEKPYKGIEKFK